MRKSGESIGIVFKLNYLVNIKKKKYKFILNFENMNRLHPKINI